MPVIFPAIVILPPPTRRARPRARRAWRTTTSRSSSRPTRSNTACGDRATVAGRACVPFAPGPGTARGARRGRHRQTCAFRRRPSTARACSRCRSSRDVAGKRVVIFRGDGGREQLARHACARAARASTTSTCYRRAATGKRRAGLAEAFARRTHRCDDAHRPARGSTICGTLADEPRRAALARAPDVRPASAHRGACARARARRTSRPAAADAGLIAGLLEWFAAHPRRAEHESHARNPTSSSPRRCRRFSTSR